MCGDEVVMLQRIIDSQYRRPSGLLGRWIGRRMAQQHVPENVWTVSLLEAQPHDRILEIGFGPGLAVEKLAPKVTEGLIAGIDFSRVMVAAATTRNAAAVRAGRVKLRYGDAIRLVYDNASFDKAYSIHSIYFWRKPAAALKEIHRVLKPGGSLVMTILPKEKWNTGDSGKYIGMADCTPYSGEEMRVMLLKAGFSSTRIEMDTSDRSSPSNYSVIGTK
jgi:ubiquinone/menaquinone biosynthesis C-methylase UbiE